MKARHDSGKKWRPVGDLARDKIDTLLLIVTCALIMAPHGGHLPLWITQVSAALLVWRFWITFRGERLPPRWLLLPVCMLVMVGVLLTYKTMLGRDTGVAMLVLLIAFKLLEMHAKRDAFVVVFLSFFLILMNFFYSQSVITTILMGLAVVLVLTVQISFQYAHRAPPLRERLRLAGSIVGMALPLMVVLFILFPRFHAPLWGMPGEGNRGSTGLSNSMAPGNISKLALSGDVAFRVLFEGSPPPASQLYWRGPVLGHFDGRTWTPLQNSRANAGLPQAVDVTTGTPVRYQVTLEPTSQQTLFALEMPVAAPQVDRHFVRLEADLQLTTRSPINQRLRYDATSLLQDSHSAAPIDADDRSLRDWLQLPAGFNPETRQLAQQLRESSNDTATLIRQVLTLFREQEFRYTLEPPLLGRHTVDEFLFGTRAGFCEHYANAFVVLMRAMGVPARVVTGYQGGEINPLDGYMTVRQSDAHAWAEVWIADRGWLRVDPTAAVAPARIEGSLRSPLPQNLFGGLVRFDVGDGSFWAGALHRLRINWEALNNRWNQIVLDYSAVRQRDLLKAFGFINPDWRTLAGVMSVALVAVLALIALPLTRNQRRRDPLEAVFLKFCRALARQGQQRITHEGPQQWRRRLLAERAASPEKLQAWAEFLQLYETVRYAAPADRDRAGVSSVTAGITRLRKLLPSCR